MKTVEGKVPETATDDSTVEQPTAKPYQKNKSVRAGKPTGKKQHKLSDLEKAQMEAQAMELQRQLEARQKAREDSIKNALTPTVVPENPDLVVDDGTLSAPEVQKPTPKPTREEVKPQAQAQPNGEATHVQPTEPIQDEKARRRAEKQQKQAEAKALKEKEKQLKAQQKAQDDSIKNVAKLQEDSIKSEQKARIQAQKQAEKDKVALAKQKEQERKDKIKARQEAQKQKAKERKEREKQREKERKERLKLKEQQRKEKLKAAEEKRKAKERDAKLREQERKMAR